MSNAAGISRMIRLKSIQRTLLLFVAGIIVSFIGAFVG